MKLNVNFHAKKGVPSLRPVVTDDRGERMPRVRRVKVKHRYNKPCEVQITLLVDGDAVTVGEVPE